MVRVLNGHIHRLQARSIAAPLNITASLPALQRINIDLVENSANEDALSLSSVLDNGYVAIQ